MKDVIHSLEVLDFFKGGYVTRLFDNAYRFGASCSANVTDVVLCEVATNTAKVDVFFESGYGFCQLLYVLVR